MNCGCRQRAWRPILSRLAPSRRRCYGQFRAAAAEQDGVAQLKAYVDYGLRREEKTIGSEDVPGSAIAYIDSVRLGANDPCEDTLAVMHSSAVESYMLGVFDGHGGPQCSAHVAARLFDYVCSAALPRHNIRPSSSDFREHMHWLLEPLALPHLFADAHEYNVAGFKRRLVPVPDPVKDPEEEMNWGKQGTVRMALQHAFLSLDYDLLQAASPDQDGNVERQNLPVAVSGSTACVAHIRRNNLHIANSGDSRAVLGVANPSGGWTARRLSIVHTMDNAAEVQRIRAAHPLSEHDSVLKGGRLLGQLFPLRAFGDCVYKWPRSLQEVALHPTYGEAITPHLLQSPPYLTAQPEVYYHRLTPNDRFLVIATDGLWDFLSPESVVRLLADHAEGRQTLHSMHVADGAALSTVLAELRKRKQRDARPKPIDSNSATHLLRHALAGDTDEKAYRRLADLMAMPAEQARLHRDDVTILVVYFDHHYLAQHFPAPLPSTVS